MVFAGGDLPSDPFGLMEMRHFWQIWPLPAEFSGVRDFFGGRTNSIC